MNATPTQAALSRLDRYIRARYPIVCTLSHEERRVLEAIASLAAARSRALYTWSITQGLGAPYPNLAGATAFDGEMTRDLVPAFESLLNHPDDGDETPPAIFVFRDLHPYLGDPVIIRYLRDVAARFETCRHTLVLLSPSLAIPAELEKVAVVIDWPLPSGDELAAILEQCERDLPSRIPITLNGDREQVVRSMRGLTQFEASSVLLNAVAATGELGESIVPHIVGEKAQIIRKSGVLEFYDQAVTMSEVGGLDELKRYATKKRLTFSEGARDFGLDPARGVLLVGVPGTGKSLSAKAIAGGQMPLLRLDIAALMGGLVGQSEANVRQAIKVAEAVAPAILWIDELEKALADNDGASDGGVMRRILGTLLTWMQETAAPVYIVATANKVSSLPPELIRRFDDTFFVDLPNKAARVEIAAVHLRKRGRDSQDFDLEALAEATWSFTGAEIEKVVKAALEEAYFASQALVNEHLLVAARQVVPIAQTMDAEIKDLQAWAKGRSRLAGEPLEPRPAHVSGRRILDI